MAKRMTAIERAQHYGAEVRKATAARNRAIVAMDKENYSLREIGEAVGLTHTAIGQILRRMAEGNEEAAA